LLLLLLLSLRLSQKCVRALGTRFKNLTVSPYTARTCITGRYYYYNAAATQSPPPPQKQRQNAAVPNTDGPIDQQNGLGNYSEIREFAWETVRGRQRAQEKRRPRPTGV